VSTRELVRQLRAAEAGRPIPRYSTKHLRVSSSPLIVSFIRMAGESRPWGIAYGRPGESPEILAAGDGRNREAVTAMLHPLAEVLLKYCRVEGWTDRPLTSEDSDLHHFPQIWFPGSRHVEMLHFLEFAYSGVPRGADKSALMPSFARLCGWLFRHSNHPGQQVVVDSAAALRTAFVFPADPVSISSLSPLVTWLTTDGDLQTRRAAAIAARQDLTELSLDPKLDSKILEPLVAERQRLRQAGQDFAEVDEQIRDRLGPHLERRWRLTATALDLFKTDARPENPGTENLVAESLNSLVKDLQYHERKVQEDPEGAFTIHPETDFDAASAAAAYLLLTASQQRATLALLHHDKELLGEAIENGTAVRSTIAGISEGRHGSRRAVFWTVNATVGEQTRLREEEKYSIYGDSSTEVVVAGIERVDSDTWIVKLRWSSSHIRRPITGYLNAPCPDPLWVGREVVLVPRDNSGMARDAAFRVRGAKAGIGAWLTHSKPPRRHLDDLPVSDIELRDGES